MTHWEVGCGRVLGQCNLTSFLKTLLHLPAVAAPNSPASMPTAFNRVEVIREVHIQPAIREVHIQPAIWEGPATAAGPERPI